MAASLHAHDATITGRRATLAGVAALHVAGLALLASGRTAGGSLAAAAVVAYTLGLRHALDADHIAMIDNSTRKFVAEGTRPASVGLAFSAGHSTVVIAAAAFVIGGSRWALSALDEASGTRQALGVTGALVAATYLLAISLTNVPALRHAWATLCGGAPTVPEPPRGILARLLTSPLAAVRRPWHVYVFGLLFGLGFDTASSVAVLMLATGAAAHTPVVALMALPVLFAAAMALGDSVNASVMVRLYASAQQRRRARYDVVITSMSIVAGLAIAAITYSGLAVEFGVAVPPLTWLAGLDTEWYGIGLLATFLAVGVAAGAAARARAGWGASSV